jgi:hypothetical protein
MYPQAELDLLAGRKRELLQKIRARREELAAQATLALRPVRWAEAIRAKWRELSPALTLMAVPLGHVVRRRLSPKTGGVVGGLLRWAPIAVSVFRSMRRGA